MPLKSTMRFAIVSAAVLGLLLVACGDDDANELHADGGDRISEEASAFTVVDVEPGTTPAMQLAVQACAGLTNRRHGGSIYVRMNDNDSRWLEELNWTPTETVDAARFVDNCVIEFPRCVRYSYAAQQALLPNILTVGAVLEAVPVDMGMPVACDNPVFDAVSEFADLNTPVLATKVVYDTYVNETSGLAMLNPGYDTEDRRVWDPAMTRDMDPSLVDLVYSEKLFVVYLVNGCIPPTPENALLGEIAAVNPWPSPIGVYGYAEYWKLFGGYVFEAQTRCVKSRNLGEIATAGVKNLSFFSSRRMPILEPHEIEQNEPETIEYDPGTTYVAFVVGDGDNIAFMMAQRREWIHRRVAECVQEGNTCEPITWTISSHLTYLAPDVLEWYYDMSHRTGTDYFMLPPSGHLYAYPASMGEETQDEFVAATERDALLLGTDGTVDWEWWNTWHRAETGFVPKYAREGGVIGGVFPVNVPYMFPTFTWWDPKRFFKVLGGRDGGAVVLFRPREWRGVDDSGGVLTKKFYLSPENMAEELSNYPLGTVAYVYMTSDGGLNLENSFMEMVKLLPAHVRLVSAGAAVRLALDANQNRDYAD
jgi:hypothetical protein